ncbi:conserved hypothetical protein [Altererythrobacter sp. B11]|uniref:hypothetical protein n=1 Tax=Altererythrobacter sp. B11 TaxID=2060312 RepID=UPI000DC7286C|nr:hypothetical protein [Altererythrobacter sp. B11]BBC72768.1 conserved hypothetical protein [Altererythrobacter sp. B11]
MQVLGTYVDEASSPRKLVILNLSQRDCRLVPEPGHRLAAGRVDFWIGGLGPFSGHAENEDETSFSVRFAEPLDERIVRHFAIG